MHSTFSREDQLLKKLQTCVGKIDSSGKPQTRVPASSGGKQNIYGHKSYARKTAPEQYLASKQAEYEKSQRKALGQFSSKYNIQYDTQQQRPQKKYNEQYRDMKKLATPSKNPLSSQNYGNYKPSVKQYQDDSCRYRKKHDERAACNYLKETNEQKFEYSSQKNKKYQFHEEEQQNTRRQSKAQVGIGRSNKKNWENEARSKFQYKRVSVNNDLPAPFQFEHQRQDHRIYRDSPQTRYQNKQVVKESVGKYEYNICQKNSNTRLNAYNDRRMSLNNSMNQTSENILGNNKKTMAVGSIASTASKRKGYADRSLNSSFQQNQKHETSNYQYKRSSAMKEPTQFNKYSNSVILQPNKAVDSAYDKNQFISGLSSIYASRQRSDRFGREQEERGRRQRQEKVEDKMKIGFREKVQDLKGLKKQMLVEKDCYSSNISGDTMEKLKRINELNQKINSRIKNIIETFDTK